MSPEKGLFMLLLPFLHLHALVGVDMYFFEGGITPTCPKKQDSYASIQHRWFQGMLQTFGSSWCQHHRHRGNQGLGIRRLSLEPLVEAEASERFGKK